RTLPAVAQRAGAGRNGPIHSFRPLVEGAMQQPDRAVPTGTGAVAVTLPGRRSRHRPRGVAPRVSRANAHDEPPGNLRNDLGDDSGGRALYLRRSAARRNLAAAAGGLCRLQGGDRLAGQSQVLRRPPAIDPATALLAPGESAGRSAIQSAEGGRRGPDWRSG